MKKKDSSWHLTCANSYRVFVQLLWNWFRIRIIIKLIHYFTSLPFCLTRGCCFPGLLHQSWLVLSSWFSRCPPRCRLQPFARTAFGCLCWGCCESDKSWSCQLWNLDADCRRQQKCPSSSLLPLLLISPQRLRFCGWPRHCLATLSEKDGSVATAEGCVSKEKTSFSVTAAVFITRLCRASNTDGFWYWYAAELLISHLCDYFRRQLVGKIFKFLLDFLTETNQQVHLHITTYLLHHDIIVTCLSKVLEEAWVWV